MGASASQEKSANSQQSKNGVKFEESTTVVSEQDGGRRKSRGKRSRRTKRTKRTKRSHRR
jgi:hypothetical protein